MVYFMEIPKDSQSKMDGTLKCTKENWKKIGKKQLPEFKLTRPDSTSKPRLYILHQLHIETYRAALPYFLSFLAG